MRVSRTFGTIFAVSFVISPACRLFFVCNSAALIAVYIAGNSGGTRLVPINFRSSG
ncbi:hypothetical protein CES85_2088 [Ochrobactrum quorumnocens]|uniref:Uncharacterized protein n=1 Tax=Ochrobactrum quorumnocens TaxID=271865 RepID=A0A248UFK0_9HYPH|nr:hypothetical protein CES85_2088 [[Ochrobactrum] quorumnocens]